MTTKKRDQHDIEQDVLERTKIDEAIAALTERKAVLNARLAGDFDETGTYPVAGVKLVISEPAKMTKADEARLQAAYPVDHYPDLYKRAIDLDAVKRAFAPALLEQFKTRGARTVSIR